MADGSITNLPSTTSSNNLQNIADSKVQQQRREEITEQITRQVTEQQTESQVEAGKAEIDSARRVLARA